MTVPSHGWQPTLAGDLKPGDVFTVGSRSRVRRVGRVEVWDRWDGARMVTVIDTDGWGLAAREVSFPLLVLGWTDGAAA